MAKLKFVILKAKPMADGRYNVKLALTHKTKTCYYNTVFNCEAKKFKEWSIQGDVIASEKMKSMYWKYQERLDSIDNPGLYDCKQLFDMVFKGVGVEYGKMFSDACKEYVERMNNDGKSSSASMIERTGRYFVQCFGDLSLRDIMPSTIFQFEEWLKKNTKNGSTTIGMHMGRIRAILNYEERIGNVTYKVKPFSQYKIAASPTRDIDVSLADMKKIIAYDADTPKKQLVKDLFLLSFYLGGMNLIDMLKADFRDDSVSYDRTKTSGRKLSRKPTVIPIIPQSREIIDKYIGVDGKLNVLGNVAYRSFCSTTTRYLRIMQYDLGIKKNIIFYSARDTFAQFAVKLGFPDSVVNYCLAHSDRSRGILRYYAQVDVEMASECIEAVARYVLG